MKYQIWLTTPADSKELVYQTDELPKALGVLEFLESEPCDGWASFTYNLETVGDANEIPS